MESIMIKGGITMICVFFASGIFILTDSDPSDFLETLFEGIGKLLYTIFILPFKSFNAFMRERRENKRKFVESQIELEKIKRQNWENGIY